MATRADALLRAKNLSNPKRGPGRGHVRKSIPGPLGRLSDDELKAEAASINRLAAVLTAELWRRAKIQRRIAFQNSPLYAANDVTPEERRRDREQVQKLRAFTGKVAARGAA